ncbi:MAG: universal stress protein [Flavobacteriaceae bacterium]|jgi:nucleotide-binding universal stress UspA family protein
MKRIIVPVDFSNVAESAFTFALEIASRYKAELLLFHNFEVPVVESQFFPVNYMDVYSSLEMAEFDFFKDKVAELRKIAEDKNLSHVAMSHILTDGDLLYNLKDVIQREKIDFVVMGTSGADNWFENLVGTNTGSLILDVNVPVLTIPENTKFKEIQTVGFTTRFRDKDQIALESVLKFSKTFNSKVKCLYVKTENSDVSEETIDKWRTKFTANNVQFYIVYDDDVEGAVNDFLVSQEIDVLAMLTYKRSFFQKIFHSSMTKKMAQNLTIPVLAFHE